jgi:uncharacterized integral membrane protein
LWLPFYTSRIWMLIFGFVTGFTLDIFTKSPGLHASACVMIAYFRPFLLGLLVPKETKELTLGSPNVRSMGGASYSVYVVILTLIHHGWLVLLETMQYPSFSYFFGKILFSAIVSFLLIIITELLFRPTRKAKGR